MISIKDSSINKKMVTEVYKSLFRSLRWNVYLLIKSTTSTLKTVHSFLSGIFKKKHENDKRQQIERIFIGNWIVSWLNRRFHLHVFFMNMANFLFVVFFNTIIQFTEFISLNVFVVEDIEYFITLFKICK